MSNCAIETASREASTWLLNSALPIWSTAGVDTKHGGFVDRIAQDGNAMDMPKRCRVQARQIYSFIQAGRLGWVGPWQQLMNDGLSFLRLRFLRSDGCVRASVYPDGQPCNDGVYNYDQAFVIFALAHAYSVSKTQVLKDIALTMVATLKRQRAHISGGFEEELPGDFLLLSNPHMHLLEAALAWMEVDEGPIWRDIATEISNLCVSRFMHPDAGAIREYYNAGWRADDVAGEIIEPGHQFEWAWLLRRWAAISRDPKFELAADKVNAVGMRGVYSVNGVTMNEIAVDFSVRNGNARLWPQTERIKAALIAASRTQGAMKNRNEEYAVEAWNALKLFLDVPVVGLWHDCLLAEGGFIPEGAPASSFYHIVCALAELIAYK